MKEIRLHGRGGQGVVKASQMVVAAAVKGGLHGQFIPFFGVERKGSPVFGYLRLSETEIRRKTQIYERTSSSSWTTRSRPCPRPGLASNPAARC